MLVDLLCTGPPTGDRQRDRQAGKATMDCETARQALQSEMSFALADRRTVQLRAEGR